MSEERVRIIEHSGRQIIVSDLNGLVEADIVPVLVASAKVIRRLPPGSALTVTDATTAQFNLRTADGGYDRVSAEAVRNCITGNGPHVKAAAIAIGHDEGKKVLVEFFNRTSARDFETFVTIEDALEWLVTQ